MSNFFFDAKYYSAFMLSRREKLSSLLRLPSSDDVIFDTLQFYNCQCIGQNITIPETVSTASIGYCELECSNFWVYIILFSFFVFIHSTSEVGSMLLILRCVDPRDKAMALGLIQFAIGLFGNYLLDIFSNNRNRGENLCTRFCIFIKGEKANE